MSGSYESLTIDDMISKLKKAKSDGFETVELNKDYYPYDSDAYPVLNIVKNRLENDEEYAIRQKQHEYSLQRERDLYESLKMKYGEE
jgi:hypothetical protein